MFTPKPSILLIDDEEPVRLLLDSALSEVGFEVVSVATATEGLSFLKEATFNMLILDAVLPDTVGFDFLRRVRAEHKSLPILVLTGMDYEEDIMRGALLAGANGYMSKFVDMEALITEIHRILRHPDLYRQT